MRKKLVKIALAASIVLAWAFTSCSDDKESWLTCEEFMVLGMSCAMQSGCSDDDEDCPALEKCMMDAGACGGASMKKCEEHYEKECNFGGE